MVAKPSIIKEIEAYYKVALSPSTETLEDFMRYGLKDQDKNKYLMNGTSLIGLNLRSNDLVDFPFVDQEALHQLQALYLGENKLTELTIPKEMSNLVYLDVGDNETLKTVRFEGDMPQLKSIELSDSGVEVLHLPNCDRLEKIDVSRNQLSEFSFSSTCPELTWLDLSGNKGLKSLYFPAGFASLKFVYLYKSGLEVLRIAGAMSSLKVLDLEGNTIQTWPKGFQLPETLETLYLTENPLTGIPETIIGKGDRNNSAENVRNYLLSVQKPEEVQYLHEGKMVLIGNGMVGKTSIRRKLLDRNAPLTKIEERTEGLEVEITPYPIKDLPPNITGLETPIDFKLNIWDFGGQSRYREVQQLLCSPKTLYLFVTSVNDDPNDTAEYVNFDYWYTMVRALSNDEEGKPSPVIYVTNKLDLQPSYFSKRDYQYSVPFDLQISCETLKNFEFLPNAIKSSLQEVGDGIFTDSFNMNWLKVKSDLEARQQENHITYQEYQQMCMAQEMSASDAKTWLLNLVRIGTIIFFDDLNNPQPDDWVILNPNWVTKAIFQIIDSNKHLSNPVSRDQLLREWADKSEEEIARLVKLMHSFHLLFEQENEFGAKEYVIPALLTSEQPNLSKILPTKVAVNEIRFSYRPFIPAGTVHKLIVRMKDHLYDSRVMWRNNVILFDRVNQVYAHVWEEWQNKQVYVRFYGDDPSSLFQEISTSLNAINSEFSQAQTIDELEHSCEFLGQNTWRTISDGGKGEGLIHVGLWKKRKVVELKKIYFSFHQKKLAADQEDLFAKEMADQVEARITAANAVQIIRQDLAVEYGGSTEAYAKQLGRADLVIPFIDDAFLKDVNRMFELIEVFRNSKEEKSDYIKRLMPVFIQEFDFQEASILLKYLKHWKKKQTEWEDLKQFNMKDLHDELNKIIRINENLGNVLRWLGDVYPNSDIIISENDGEKLLSGIQQRIQSLIPEKDLFDLIKSLDEKMDEALDALQQLDANDQALIKKMDLHGNELQNISKLMLQLERDEIPKVQLQKVLIEVENLMSEAAKANEAIAAKWELTQKRQAEYPDFKGKFKTTIPIIPFILRYETELGLDLTKIARGIWKRGIVF